MIVLPAALSHRPYVVTRPPFGEFRTDRLEAFDQLDKIAVADMAPIIGTESGERVLAPRRPIDEQGAQRWVGEDKPNHISLVCGHLLEVEKEGPRGLVPRKDVPSTPHDKGRHFAVVIDHALEARTDRFALGIGIPPRLAQRESKELSPLYGIEPQHARKVV